jgi:hypothetical protein
LVIDTDESSSHSSVENDLDTISIAEDISATPDDNKSTVEYYNTLTNLQLKQLVVEKNLAQSGVSKLNKSSLLDLLLKIE